MRSEFRTLNSEFRIKGPTSSLRLANLTAFILLSAFCVSPPALAGTHVTATYDLGVNPRVMATVNGTPEYGLVFAQRNKPVTYNNVQYSTSEIKGYLDANGQLNDGAGNLWLDLIPNLGATPADGFYVVTFNIQGRVHSEIWVVPDVATVDAGTCRQAQPPSATAPALFYQFLQLAGADLPQRQKLNLSGSGVACTDNAGQLRTECAIAGGTVPLASPAASGTVKTDATSADPVVYLKSSADSLLAGKASLSHTHAESDVTNLVADLAAKSPVLHTHADSDVANLVSDLAGKVPSTRLISTTAPLAGGGALSANLTLSMPQATGSESGYLSPSDWIAFNNKETALTFNSPLLRSTNAISCPTCVTAVSGTSPISSSGGTTPTLSIATASASAIGAGNVAGTANEITVSYAGGTGTISIASNLDLTNKSSTAPVKATTAAGAPASCAANKDLLIQTDATPAGQQLFLCNSAGIAWNKVGDGGGGGGTHALLSATHNDTTAASVARGDLIAGIGATPTWQRLPVGASGTVLHGGAEPSYAAVSLSADVTGILTSTNGGTGNGFAKFTGPTTAEKTFTLPDASATVLTTNAAVTPAQGGTGQATTPTSGRYLRGNGTNWATSAGAAAGTGS